jgi:hypothetical protein
LAQEDAAKYSQLITEVINGNWDHALPLLRELSITALVDRKQSEEHRLQMSEIREAVLAMSRGLALSTDLIAREAVGRQLDEMRELMSKMTGGGLVHGSGKKVGELQKGENDVSYI